MPFHSILFDRPANKNKDSAEEAAPFFADLFLDQVLQSMTAGREEYNLDPFFCAPLTDVETVRYRHEVLRDLEQKSVFGSVESFAENMRAMRKCLAQAKKIRHKYQKERWHLAAVEIYCEGASTLAEELTQFDLQSRGFMAFREYVAHFTKSDHFRTLLADTKELKAGLAGLKYCIHIKGNRVRVNKYEGQADYSADVEQAFAKFKQAAVKDYRTKLPDSADMNQVEASVLNLVARLYPNVFLALDDYYDRYRNYLDATIDAFDREIQFYIAYLEYVERFKRAGLQFCYPTVSTRSKQVHVRDAFDLALANKLIPEGSAVVCNDFYLNGPERIIVVTGPNQGGKTTFARMFGQLYYLASLGFPVPGSEASLFMPDRIFTHFEKEEDLTTLRGNLEDELVRIHDILQSATSASVIVMNESFGSTTLSDALFLGKDVMTRLTRLDAVCVYVTFVDELAAFSDSTVSMVGAVVPDNPAERTYKIERRAADGLAYAAAIAKKYGLTYESLRSRIVR